MREFWKDQMSYRKRPMSILSTIDTSDYAHKLVLEFCEKWLPLLDMPGPVTFDLGNKTTIIDRRELANADQALLTEVKESLARAVQQGLSTVNNPDWEIGRQTMAKLVRIPYGDGNCRLAVTVTVHPRG